MRNKFKRKIYNIFYNEYKMFDKYQYIKNVMKSCKYEKQLVSAYNWGYDTMQKWCNNMIKVHHKEFCSIEAMEFFNYANRLTKLLTDDLTKYYNEKYNKVYHN